MDSFTKLFEIILEKYGLTVFVLTVISAFALLLVKYIINSLEAERQRTSKYIADMIEANTRMTTQHTVALNTAVNSLIKLENASNYQRDEHRSMIEDNKHIMQCVEDIKRRIEIN